MHNGSWISYEMCSEVGGPSEFKSQLQKFYVWNFSSGLCVNIDQNFLLDTIVKDCAVDEKHLIFCFDSFDLATIIYSLFFLCKNVQKCF